MIVRLLENLKDHTPLARHFQAGVDAFALKLGHPSPFALSAARQPAFQRAQ
jgi:hypothetical protein